MDGDDDGEDKRRIDGESFIRIRTTISPQSFDFSPPFDTHHPLTRDMMGLWIPHPLMWGVVETHSFSARRCRSGTTERFVAWSEPFRVYKTGHLKS